jgi:transposase
MSHSSLYIGIDISKAHLDVFTHEIGEFSRYRNTSAGIGELIAALDETVALIVLEPTAGHEKPVTRYSIYEQPLERPLLETFLIITLK